MFMLRVLSIAIALPVHKVKWELYKWKVCQVYKKMFEELKNLAK